MAKATDQCRLCLSSTSQKCLQPIFTRTNNHMSYSLMICNVADVKVLKGDGLPDKICNICRRQLKTCYDFKLMIEKSDVQLRNGQCAGNKLLKFNNITEIKIDLDLVKSEYDDKYPEVQLNFDSIDNAMYHGTLIKKIHAIKEKEEMTISELLNSIKNEDDLGSDHYYGDTDYGPHSDGSEECVMPSVLRTRSGKTYKASPKVKRKASVYRPKRNSSFDDKDYVCGPANKKKKQATSRIGRPTIRELIKPAAPVLPVTMDHLIFKGCVRNRKKMVNDNDKNRICDYCGFITKNLNAHMLQHTGERKYRCDTCGKSFFKRRQLIHHMIVHDPSRKQHSCDKCPATFFFASGLKSHMVCHIEGKDLWKYTCEICGKKFKRRGGFRRHKLIHNGTSKAVKCELCMMSFRCKVGLRHHMRIHTRERPYNCELCSQPYSYKRDFNRHCYKKHGVFFSRRSVYVMNSDVLKKERELMKNILLRIHGIVKEGEPLNPLEGPQSPQAFAQLVKALKDGKVPIAAGLEQITVSPGHVALIDNSPP